MFDLRASPKHSSGIMKVKLWLGFGVLSAVFPYARVSSATEAYIPFKGEKTAWHEGFDRFDYAMDEESFAITPFKRPGERCPLSARDRGPNACGRFHRGENKLNGNLNNTRFSQTPWIVAKSIGQNRVPSKV